MKISEVSEKYGLTPDTLRFYEKEGLLPRIKKSKSGVRNYSEEDCKWIEFVKCMRSAGLSIDVLRKYIDLFHEGAHTSSKRRQILIEEREKLIAKRDALQATIDRLDYKINVYYKNRDRQKNLI